MSTASSSSSLTSKFQSFIPQTNLYYNKTQFLHSSSKTHLKFSTFSPSISLKTHQNPENRNGSLVTKMGTYNVQIVVEEDEHEEKLLQRFRREVFRAGVLRESKRRMFFENSQDKRKRKTREAAKKYATRRPRPKVVKEDPVKIIKKQVYNSDDDDWDLPDGDLPLRQNKL